MATPDHSAVNRLAQFNPRDQFDIVAYPSGDNLASRIRHEVIKASMIQRLFDRQPQASEFGVINYPPHCGVNLASDLQAHAVGMAVHSVALVML